MSRGKDDTTFLASLLSVSLYKRNQGRMTRRLTAIAVAAVALIGCWTLSHTVLSQADAPVRVGAPSLLGLVGLWLAFRLVNFPRFADFLVSVEAEMDKVSWADIEYLKRATGVVLGVMLLLGLVLSLYDLFWLKTFSWIGILDQEALQGAAKNLP